jgi:hypothetical protein
MMIAVSIAAFAVQSQTTTSFQHDNSEPRRRSLRLPVLGFFNDPKKVEEKPILQTKEAGDDMENDNNEEQPIKSFNILALGGSITWGAELEKRHEEAYPYLIGDLYNEYMHNTLDVSVDNLAIRASGADYPSKCLQSLVADANPDDPDKSYDLVCHTAWVNFFGDADDLSPYHICLTSFHLINMHPCPNKLSDSARFFLEWIGGSRSFDASITASLSRCADCYGRNVEFKRTN